MLRTYPSPALIILVACGIAISYASQQQQNYDPRWLAISSLLFIAGCLVSFNLMQSLPAPRPRIVMTQATWQRAKIGLGVGIGACAASVLWLLWGIDALPGGNWLTIMIVMGPTLALGLAGLVLIYYWLGLWAFGEVQQAPEDEPGE